MPLPPQVTPEQRDAALEKAAEVRAARADIKTALKRGTLTLAEVLKNGATDDIAGRMKVSALLTALPGIGKVKAAHLMDGLGIKENRRVRGLSARQREALETVFASVPGV